MPRLSGKHVGCEPPVNLRAPYCPQKLIGSGKGPGAKETAMGGKGAGMGRFDYVMMLIGNQGFLSLGMFSPQDKDYRLLPSVQVTNHLIGKDLPAHPLMGVGLSMPNG